MMGQFFIFYVLEEKENSISIEKDYNSYKELYMSFSLLYGLECSYHMTVRESIVLDVSSEGYNIFSEITDSVLPLHSCLMFLVRDIISSVRLKILF